MKMVRAFFFSLQACALNVTTVISVQLKIGKSYFFKDKKYATPVRARDSQTLRGNAVPVQHIESKPRNLFDFLFLSVAQLAYALENGTVRKEKPAENLNALIYE
jgi:hypothetical protein